MDTGGQKTFRMTRLLPSKCLAKKDCSWNSVCYRPEKPRGGETSQHYTDRGLGRECYIFSPEERAGELAAAVVKVRTYRRRFRGVYAFTKGEGQTFFARGEH